MLTRLVRIQLGIFAVVTVLAVGAIAILYLHLPSRMGIGTYKVTADFIGGGGIYKSANVTYRGVTVGRVEDVRLTDHGIDAQIRLNSSTKVPGNVTATVKSMSAIGEQYIDLVPPEGAAAAGVLHNGARIGQDRTAIGQDIAGMLDQAQTLVNSVANSRLRDLLRNTFEGFNGSGQELARMIASSRQLIDEANANFEATEGLIDQFEPFLDAQIRSGDDIKTLARSLATVTTEVRNADPQLREVLQILPSVTDEANTTFSGIRASFPTLAASIANFGRVGVIYRKSIEQALVVFPALMAALITVAGAPRSKRAPSWTSRSTCTTRRRAWSGSCRSPRCAPRPTRPFVNCPRICIAKRRRMIQQRSGGPQLSVHGIPGQAGADHSALS